MINNITLKDIPENLQSIALEIGVDNLMQIVKLAGGTSIYIPSEKNITKPARNRTIKEKFKGDNYRQLATAYEISEIQVRKIINSN